jgi:5-methylcytosine-specific restriction protein A
MDWSGATTAHEALDGAVEEMELGGKLTPFITEVSPETLQQEKEKARALKKTRWWQRQLDRGVCFYCQASVARDQATLDHIVPLIRGGRSIRSNIVLACKTCNSRKKYLLPMEWEEYLRQARAPAGADPAVAVPMTPHEEPSDE